jgi:CRISPR-associated endonuclease/helicase Cas3
MTALPALNASDFAPFFHSVHGKFPFPWQERLARGVTEKGWPNLLDLPTGSGKTAALDIAVFALALDAGRRPRAAPLRIVYVVDRRTIVDQAHERALHIQKAILEAGSDVVTRVKSRLLHYTDDGPPLRTALLRGGIARDDDWSRTPDQPLIAVSTVDQVGSRLLFRGYGITDRMKPVHAGLLGCDVLYLLDEVHLSQPFRETLAAVAGRYRSWAERSLDAPFAVVEMSATPAAPADPSNPPFGLDEADRQNPVLAARMQSAKRARLVFVKPRTFVGEVEKNVDQMLHRPGATVAVVVNRVNTAREVADSLRTSLATRAVDVHLLTGRMRPFDRDAVEQGLRPRIGAGRERRDDDPPVVVVATQSIEAGADFDFDDLVTECASLDALRQRFGRLDRLGALGGAAQAVIVARADRLSDDAVYGNAVGETWTWLQEHGSEDVVDFGIDALSVPHNAREMGLLSPQEVHAPILLPSHIDAWSQTAPIPHPDPDVAIWLHGPDRGLADVLIVWRADLTGELLRHAVSSGGDAAKAAEEIAIDIVDALPPVSSEAMSVPFLAAKRWLQGLPEPEFADVEGMADVDDEAPRATEAEPKAILIWQGEESRVVPARDLRPGQTVVVPANYGGIDRSNWAPSATDAVKDVAEVTALLHRQRPTLRLHPAVVRSWFGEHNSAPVPGSLDDALRDDEDVVAEWLREHSADDTDARVRTLMEQLLADPKSLRVGRLRVNHDPKAGEYFVVTGKRRAARYTDPASTSDEVSTDDARSSFTGAPVPLADHLRGVADIAVGFAERIGLPEDIVSDLRIAAEWHDAGKADERFQRWLHGGSRYKALVQPAPLAKSSVRLASRRARERARERAGYPKHERHELMSVALIESAAAELSTRANDWLLVQYLIATHHGYCRPLAPWVEDPQPVDVAFDRDGIAVRAPSSHQLARLDSGIAERFWIVTRRYGWWGAAWLETLIRLADHRQSDREQQQKVRG